MSKKNVSLALSFFLCVYTCTVARGEDKNAKITVLTSGLPCQILIDGEKIGTSPISWFVEPGIHEVTSIDDAGREKHKTVTAVAEESVLVKFDYPLPEPVVDAAAGSDTKLSEGSSLRAIGISVAGVCLVGGGVVLAANWGNDASDGLSEVTVDTSTITLSVKTNLDAADGDRIDILLNGTNILDDYELTTSDRSVTLNLQSGLNIVDIQAQNIGSEPPNSGVATISDVTEGRATQQWSIPAGATARLLINAP